MLGWKRINGHKENVRNICLLGSTAPVVRQTSVLTHSADRVAIGCTQGLPTCPAIGSAHRSLYRVDNLEMGQQKQWRLVLTRLHLPFSHLTLHSNDHSSYTLKMVAQRRLKVALIGLGRLGAIRARILAFQQPRIELVAACDTKPGSSEWAAANLPPSVNFFADPEDCMKNSGAEALLISTATAFHAPLIIQGLDLDLVSLPVMV